MKIILTFLLSVFLSVSFSQSRKITLRTYPRDSVNLHLDENYFMIEDTCSTVVRYGHLKTKERRFFGPFRDLNKYDPSIVLAEGKYTEDGKLDGPMKMNYLNGDPLAEGSFDHGKMTGAWVIYYPGSKKRLEFDGKGSETTISNAWDKTGKQLVTNGTGVHRSDLGQLYWEGKLLNGRPDGVWKCKKIDDRTGTVLGSETFKNGAFVKGSGPIGNYTDASRIILAADELLPINNASRLTLSSQACDPSMSRKKVVYAVYKHGRSAFSEELKNQIVPVFTKVDLKLYPYKTFEVKGIINEEGRLSDLDYVEGWSDRMASSLIQALYRLPFMEPALVDGKVVKSGITFKFKIDQSVYSYSWQLNPIR